MKVRRLLERLLPVKVRSPVDDEDAQSAAVSRSRLQQAQARQFALEVELYGRRQSGGNPASHDQ